MASEQDPRTARTGDQSDPATGTTPADAEGETLDFLEIGPEGDDILEFEESGTLQARIKVVGVGGGGGNALNSMIRSGLGGVEFCAANTDAQALECNEATLRVQLGTAVTRGLGCGANPDKGRAAALEDRERLRDLLTGSDMVFVTAGLGGGTGTGAAPVVAEVAREVGALTVAVVTKPFPFEGRVRTRHADAGLEELRRVVDTLITIPNNRLLALAGKQTALTDAFKLADAVLLNAVKGISDLITVHGLINLDFADVRTIMNEMGQALMGTGIGRGDTRAADAAQAAISSPLLEDVSIDGARGVLINISGGSDMTLYEVNEASTLVQEAAHEDANIIFGAVLDETIPEGELRVTVIATGLDDPPGDRGSRWTEQPPAQEFVAPPAVHAQEPAAPAPVAQQAEAPLEVPVQAPAEPTPAAEQVGAQQVAAETVAEFEPEVEPEGLPTEDLLRDLGGTDFISPFDEEDELDVPAFLRKKQA